MVQLAAILVAVALTTACSKAPSSPAGAQVNNTPQVPATLQVYKNGLAYDWAWGTGWPCVLWSQTSGWGTLTDSASDSLNTDTLAVEVTSHGYFSTPQYYTGSTPDLAAYYPNGHLQFDIEINYTTIVPATLVVTGVCGTGQSVSTSILSLVSNGSWVHVSLPISTVYPPSTLSTLVYEPFNVTATYSGTPIAANNILFDDIKWTGN